MLCFTIQELREYIIVNPSLVTVTAFFGDVSPYRNSLNMAHEHLGCPYRCCLFHSSPRRSGHDPMGSREETIDERI